MSAIVHGLVLLVIIIVPLVMSWRARHKEREIITYVDLRSAPVVPPPVETVTPEPEVKPPPPVKKDIPEPAPKKKKKKRKIEVSRKRVRRQDEPPPKKNELTPEEIRKLLKAGAKSSTTQTVKSDLPTWYFALVQQTMYEAWSQPSDLGGAAGRIVRAEIRIEKDGRISKRSILRSSGITELDTSVKTAIHAVNKLKPLPSSFPGKYKDVVIDFELSGGL
jgi:TonB family protein